MIVSTHLRRDQARRGDAVPISVDPEHKTQADAETAARQEAIRAHAELVVHGSDGRIERKNSYGHDPRNVEG